MCAIKRGLTVGRVYMDTTGCITCKEYRGLQWGPNILINFGQIDFVHVIYFALSCSLKAANTGPCQNCVSNSTPVPLVSCKTEKDTFQGLLTISSGRYSSQVSIMHYNKLVSDRRRRRCCCVHVPVGVDAQYLTILFYNFLCYHLVVFTKICNIGTFFFLVCKATPFFSFYVSRQVSQPKAMRECGKTRKKKERKEQGKTCCFLYM